MDADRRAKLKEWFTNEAGAWGKMPPPTDVLCREAMERAREILALLAYVDELEAAGVCRECKGVGGYSDMLGDWERCPACGGTGKLADAVRRRMGR